MCRQGSRVCAQLQEVGDGYSPRWVASTVWFFFWDGAVQLTPSLGWWVGCSSIDSRRLCQLVQHWQRLWLSLVLKAAGVHSHVWEVMPRRSLLVLRSARWVMQVKCLLCFSMLSFLVLVLICVSEASLLYSGALPELFSSVHRCLVIVFYFVFVCLFRRMSIGTSLSANLLMSPH